MTQHYQVDTTKTMATLTKAFANKTFQTAAVDCPTRAFFCDRKAQPRRLAAIASSKNRKAGVNRF